MGVAAWTAPVVLAQSAHGQEAVCTPKCLPSGTPQFTATPEGLCGAVYTVIVTLVLLPGSVECLCGGTPQVTPATLVRRFPRRFRGNADLTGNVRVQCLDQSGDPCPVTCRVTVTVNITGNPGNDCAQTNATVLRVVTTC